MIRKECPSYQISIFIAGDPWKAQQVCREYCDDIGFCITVTESTYVYRGDDEIGVIVGVINYPRFPMSPEGLFGHASLIAGRLREALGQDSYTIQTPDKTVWISYREQDA